MTTETLEAPKTYAFSAEIAKVLKLMIHSLYTNKDIFLRELVSNASDACDKLRYMAVTDAAVLGDDAELKISIMGDEKARTLTIRDNGVGMSHDDLIANLGTIAKSGTEEFLQQLGDKKDASLIGQFGVGFYSSFMVADKVVVKSRKAGESQAWQWESAGEGEYTVSPLAEEFTRGTEITLHLRKEDKIYADKHKISFIVQTYSDHISFPIFGEDGQLNTAGALWARPAGEVTAEQYKEFYHHVAHQVDEPWMTLHNKMEGKTSYTNLLFIPSRKPFDLFTPERRRRVKLYVKRVFITEEANLVPAYLRFVQGVVDSEDLPLNISRETLQHNPLIEKISESVTTKVLGELKKKMAKAPEEYATFWQNFGAVLKEGLCEGTTPKEKILEVCQFHSSAQEGTTSMDAYVERMKPEQEGIYFLLGDRLETLRNHPQLEGFRKQGIEVLLFADHVDDFWVNVVQDYKGKALKSVTKAELKAKEETPEVAGMEALVTMLKDILGDQVRDVRTTHKLAESPVCLAVGEGDMDIRMERFMRENKQLPNTAYAKILEINPDHPVITALATKTRSAEVEDMAWLLLDQARIIEGEEITDPAAFSRRLTQFLTKGLAA
jgi:molecular chaperone HtpG